MPKKQRPQTALYVRLPAVTSDKLNRASEELGIPKKDLVAGLVETYVDPDSQRGLSALGTLSQPRKLNVALSDRGADLGSYSFHPYEPPEVLNVAQAAQLLQVEESVVAKLAEAGTLPGRKLGAVWRFSHAALIAWLSTPEPPR